MKDLCCKKAGLLYHGSKDIDRVMMVQFHQSYSYEDYNGIPPFRYGFELKKGTFTIFVKGRD